MSAFAERNETSNTQQNYPIFTFPGKLKYRAQDFQVHESYIIDQSLPAAHDNHLLLLKKCGFSTFDAIRHLSRFLDLASNKFSYYGLKDEDGITQQLINIEMPVADLQRGIDALNQQNAAQDCFLQLSYLQPSPHRLKIGSLIGNNFFITIRNIAKSLADKFAQQGCYLLNFLNYYGPQRFCLPGEKPRAHLIGDAILKTEFANALQLIALQNNAIGQKARIFTDDPQIFFANLDPREKNFFINAFYSHLWNQQLIERLTGSGIALSKHIEQEIIYFYAVNSALAKYHVPETMLQYKTRPEDPQSAIYTASRPGLIQVMFQVVKVEPDIFHPEYYAVQMKFFLPSGCYATMALAQLLHQESATCSN